ncbi:MAG TPA: hypothetical protein VGL04_04235, partial [Sporichthyaceae bacterium]
MTTTPHLSRTAPVGTDELARLVAGTHHDPHSVLGAHPWGGAVTVRVLRPFAQEITVLSGGERYPLHH